MPNAVAINAWSSGGQQAVAFQAGGATATEDIMRDDHQYPKDRLNCEERIAQKAVLNDLIDDVVRELNEVHGRATLDLALVVGKIVIARFYGGDFTSWREHRAKEVSFRRLAARAETDLRFSASQLYRAVAVYELSCRLHLENGSRLTMTHLRAVLGLPETAQTQLLTAAEAELWSSERIEREAAAIRQGLDQRRGRPRAPAVVSAVRVLVKSWRHVATTCEQHDVLDLTETELRSLYRALDEVRGQLERLARRLGGGPTGTRNSSGPAAVGG
jgi:hypothetical protein